MAQDGAARVRGVNKLPRLLPCTLRSPLLSPRIVDVLYELVDSDSEPLCSPVPICSFRSLRFDSRFHTSIEQAQPREEMEPQTVQGELMSNKFVLEKKKKKKR